GADLPAPAMSAIVRSRPAPCLEIVSSLISGLENMSGDSASFVLRSSEDVMCKPGPAKGKRPSTTRRLQRLTRLFAALSATNEAILRAEAPDQLCQLVCEAAQAAGDAVGTAILLSQPPSDLLRFAASSGHGLDRLRSAEVSANEAAPSGNDLAGVAYRSGKACVSNDVLNDPRTKVWHADARRDGVNAAAAIPLVRAGSSIGVLVVYLRERGALDEEMVAFLMRMVANLVFALDGLDRHLPLQ